MTGLPFLRMASTPWLAPVKGVFHQGRNHLCRVKTRAALGVRLLREKTRNPGSLTQGYLQFLWDEGDRTHLLDHSLGSNSIVLDVGGYLGDFAGNILKRYGCRLHTFEPVSSFCELLRQKFNGDARVQVWEYGWSDLTKWCQIFVDGEASSTNPARAPKASAETVLLRDVAEVFDELRLDTVDLRSINIEGGEYEVLRRMLDDGLLGRVRILQVQFHYWENPDYHKRRAQLVRDIQLTHPAKFCFPFVWECYQKDLGLLC